MTDIIQLKAAKFNGVPFLFKDTTTTGGNRLIKFNYPGSDAQAIERQGKLPRTFNMVIVIPHDDYFAQKKAILDVLEDGRKGVLTHPYFGDVENVIPGRYTLTEKLTELGRAEISVPFEIDDFGGVPVVSSTLVSQVKSSGLLVNDQVASDLADNFSVSSKLSNTITDSFDSLNGFADDLITASETSDPLTDNISGFNKDIQAFRAKIGSLIVSPADLAGEIGSLLNSLNILFETPEAVVGAFTALFSFGSNDPVFPVDENGLASTASRTARLNNRDQLRANVKAQALSYSYTSAVDTNYATEDDLELAQADLELKYIDLRDNQKISNEALELLDRQRIDAQSSFTAILVSTQKIVTIEVPTIQPLAVVIYAEYGSTELVDIIAELNDITQTSFVEGTIKVLAS